MKTAEIHKEEHAVDGLSVLQAPVVSGCGMGCGLMACLVGHFDSEFECQMVDFFVGWWLLRHAGMAWCILAAWPRGLGVDP